ncbi:MAG: 4-hydroxybenzoate synthetase [Gammaproteobacteria bacterium]|nr:MAG: 4-hydroxybenzoate synthetase [Gammaproteobacteria bacterium]
MLEDFKTKGYIAGGIITNKRNECIDLAIMPAIVRTLLVTDGTVTKTLEAYFWEPIVITPLGQQVEPLQEDLEGMDRKKGDEILRRNVSISGESSSDIYAYATSIINLNALPSDVCEQLVHGKIGIGELLRDKGLETYRQVIDIYREINEEVLPGSPCTYCGELICRTYHIHLNHAPVIQVTEKFPLRLYQK